MQRPSRHVRPPQVLQSRVRLPQVQLFSAHPAQAMAGVAMPLAALPQLAARVPSAVRPPQVEVAIWVATRPQVLLVAAGLWGAHSRLAEGVPLAAQL